MLCMSTLESLFNQVLPQLFYSFPRQQLTSTHIAAFLKMRLFICRVLLLEVLSTASLASCSMALTIYVRLHLNTVGLASCSVPTLPFGCRIKLFITIHRSQLCFLIVFHKRWNWFLTNCNLPRRVRPVATSPFEWHNTTHLMSFTYRLLNRFSRSMSSRTRGFISWSQLSINLSICVAPSLAGSD